MVPSETIPRRSTTTTEPHSLRNEHCGEICFPRVSFCVTAPAWKSFSEMLAADRTEGKLNEVRKAAYGYLALSIDKFINWNARLSSWNVNLEGMRSVFDRHDFAFKWSYAEMAPLIVGLGYDWVIGQTAKCIR